MKILQINCSSTGSTGKIARSIHRKLLEEGHDSFYAYGYGAKCNEKSTFQISNYFDIRIHGKLAKLTGFAGCFSLICTWRLLHKIDKIHPDIIHLHNIHGSYLNVFMLFNYIKKKISRLSPHCTTAGPLLEFVSILQAWNVKSGKKPVILVRCADTIHLS